MRYVFLVILAAIATLVFVSMTGSETTIVGTSWPSMLLGEIRELPERFLDKFSFNDDRHAILFLGQAGSGWTAGELTDTILLAVLEPKEKRGIMLSIPRDLLVALPGGTTTKINTLWVLGKNDARRIGKSNTREASALIREAVKDITGITIDNVVVVDVAAGEQLVDALGGIAVNVQEYLDDPAFPTPGGGVERFTITQGFQVLNGKTAMQYARTRHTPRGDFDRIRRQQQVVEAIGAKARGLKLTEDIPRLIDLYAALADHIATTITLADIPTLASAAHAIPFSNVRTFALETIGDPPLLSETAGSALVPRAGTFQYRDTRTAIADLLK